MSEQAFRSIPLAPQYEETVDHFEDVAWFIAECDRASDIYERLAWVEKAAGRLDPSEVESVRLGLKAELERYSTVARCVKAAYHPIIHTHTGYVEDPDRMYVPVPRQIYLKLPPREWITTREARSSRPVIGFTFGDSEGERIYDFTEENTECARKILSEEMMWWSISQGGVGFLKRYEGKDWPYHYWKVHPDTLYFEYGGFRSFKAEFEQALDGFLGEAVREIRAKILEPKGIKLRHKVEAKETGKHE